MNACEAPKHHKLGGSGGMLLYSVYFDLWLTAWWTNLS